MYELLLYASIPSSRHHQILSILAGLTATPTPPRIFERHYIYRPTRSSDTPASMQATGQAPGQGAAQARGASQVIGERKARKPGQAVAGARFVAVVESLGGVTGSAVEEEMKREEDEEEGEEGKMGGSTQVDGAVGDGDEGAMQDVEISAIDAGVGSSATRLGYPKAADDDESESSWMLHDAEYPEPGVRSHIARRKHSRPFASYEAVVEWADRDAMTLVASFLVLGHQFVSSHVLMRLFRVVVLVPEVSQPSGQSSQGGKIWDAPLKDYEKRLLDDSGGYVLEASVMVEEGEDASITRQAEGDLTRVKKELEGVVDLGAADRNSMDTRMR